MASPASSSTTNKDCDREWTQGIVTEISPNATETGFIYLVQLASKIQSPEKVRYSRISVWANRYEIFIPS